MGAHAAPELLEHRRELLVHLRRGGQAGRGVAREHPLDQGVERFGHFGPRLAQGAVRAREDVAPRRVGGVAEEGAGAVLLRDEDDVALSLIHISEPTRPY